MGPNVKFVSPICDLISERKIGVSFFIRKKTIRNTVFFRNPSLPNSLIPWPISLAVESHILLSGKKELISSL